MNLFRLHRYLLAGGIILIVLGTVFYLQSISVVGPDSSFMHEDPQWSIYGIIIAFGGLLLIITYIVIILRN